MCWHYPGESPFIFYTLQSKAALQHIHIWDNVTGMALIYIIPIFYHAITNLQWKNLPFAAT
jgi:hypothetical protein